MVNQPSVFEPLKIYCMFNDLIPLPFVCLIKYWLYALVVAIVYLYTYVRVSLRYNDPVTDKWIMPGTMSNIGYLGALKTWKFVISELCNPYLVQ